MTPRPSSISVSEFILFSTAVACAGKTNSPVNQTHVCLHPMESWWGGINRLSQRLTLHRKDGGKGKASQDHYHGYILWFSMRRVVQFSCLACLLLTEVPSINPQNSAISTMIHDQSHGSSLLGYLHWFVFQSVILILLPGITQMKKLVPDRAHWPHSVQWSKFDLIEVSGIDTLLHSLVFSIH